MHVRQRAIAAILLLSLLISGCGRAAPATLATPQASPTPVPPPTPLPPTATASPTPAPAPSLAASDTPTRTAATATRAADSTSRSADGPTRPAGGSGMVYVPGGSFLMGSSPAQIADALALCDPHVEGGECPEALFNHEMPQHAVTLDGFWIDKAEVTNAQYRLCLEAGVCSDTPCLSTPDSNAPEQPAGCMTWADADNYCRWVGARLPTEAEWEYAARGPQSLIFPWGNRFDPARLNYCDRNCYSPWRDTAHDDGYNLAAPVGSFPSGASWCGALDMAGNMLEWVADWYDPVYYDGSPAVNPQGPESGTEHVIRGGASNQNPSYQRGAWRSSLMLSGWYGLLGFRCAASSAPTPP